MEAKYFQDIKFSDVVLFLLSKTGLDLTYPRQVAAKS